MQIDTMILLLILIIFLMVTVFNRFTRNFLWFIKFIIDYFFYYKETDLDLAIRRGDIDTVKDLIKSGVNINKKNSLGDTPLITATLCGHINIIKKLIKSGVNINKKNSLGDTSLNLAKRLAGNGEVGSFSVLFHELYPEYRDKKQNLNWTKKVKNIVPIILLIESSINNLDKSLNSAVRTNMNQIDNLVNGETNINTRNDDAWIAILYAIKRLEQKEWSEVITEEKKQEKSFGHSLLIDIIRKRYIAIAKILKKAEDNE